MDFVEGQQMGDCYDSLTSDAALNVSKSLAHIVTELYRITSEGCGSILNVNGEGDSPHKKLSFSGDSKNPSAHSNRNHHHHTRSVVSNLGELILGPLNFLGGVSYALDRTQVIPILRSGPYMDETSFIQAATWRGGTRYNELALNAIYEKLLLLWEIVRPHIHFEPNRARTSSQTFHFAHGDLTETNILLDPSSGAITGILDWEMAGFYPAWMAATTRTRFNDDACYFFVSFDQQELHAGYESADTNTREGRLVYEGIIRTISPEMYYYEREGAVLRAMYLHLNHIFPGNSKEWMTEFGEHQWDAERYGPFPFDLEAWDYWHYFVSYERLVAVSRSKRSHSYRGSGSPPRTIVVVYCIDTTSDFIPSSNGVDAKRDTIWHRSIGESGICTSILLIGKWNLSDSCSC